MRSKTFYSLLLVGFFAVSTVEAKQSKSLQYLNTLRAQAGLIPFKTNKALTGAATAHAKYLTRQQTNGHYEKKGYKGFTGVTPTDRTLNAGYPSKMVMENLSVNANSASDAIDNLMSAVYHRFVFLSTDKNEIGEGISKRPQKPKIKTAFVYNLGNASLRKLCDTYFDMRNAMPYVNNVCENSFKMIPESRYLESINHTRKQNAKLILYPYEGQINVLPAFFIEHPHPLPGSKVSGYPVTVQFNEAYFEIIKLKSFRLYDAEGNEVKKRKILNYFNDKNHKLTKYQFAFMPLDRLEYGTQYTAVFDAIADGKKIKKRWTFATFKPKGRLYKITNNSTSIALKGDKRIVLYFKPRSRKDVISGIRYKGHLKVKYLDSNTLEVTSAKRGSSIKAGDRKVVFR